MMPRVLTIDNIKELVDTVGLENFIKKLLKEMRGNFLRWDEFQKSPRHASHFDHGVIELMPICDKEFYAFKYVNGHPNNPDEGLLTVAATGMLSSVKTGYPLLVSEMTLLTAFRTAVASALASEYLARRDSKTVAMIGTGAQGEFQALALNIGLGCNKFRYFDVDPGAMQKFANNLEPFDLELYACTSIEETMEGADVIVTATADKLHGEILQDYLVKPGMHINAVGGDCPGKTELDHQTLLRSKVVVEYLQQTKGEGEIQRLDCPIYAELWQIINGSMPGRESAEEITLFDSVGFALEDFTILKYVYQLAKKHNIGKDVNLTPDIDDPKDLFSLL